MPGIAKPESWHDENKDRLIAALKKHKGNVRQAAVECEISRRLVYVWIDRYEIKLDHYRERH